MHEPDDMPRFCMLLTLLGEAFDREITRTRIEAYWLALQAVELDSFERSVQSAMRQCKYFPTPAELLELAGAGSGDDAAYRAFEVALRAVPLGPYKHVDFKDRTINATIRTLGGWPNFVGRFTDSESEKWIRVEFCKVYVAYARSSVDGESCKPLAGLSQASVIDGQVTGPKIVRIESNRLKLGVSRQPVESVGKSELVAFKRP